MVSSSSSTILRLVLCVSCLGLTLGCGGDPQRAAERHLARGDAYLEEGRVPEAAIEYRNAVQRAPLWFEARVRLGDLFAREGLIREASEEHIRAADIRPEDPDAQVRAGELLLAVAEAEDARIRAEQALAVNDEHPRAQLLLARAFAALGDVDTAVVEAERAVDLAPDSGSARVFLGALHVDGGHRELALATLTGAVEVEPEAREPRLALARFHWVTGDLGAAEAEFLAAIDLLPGDAAANWALAEFYAVTNRLSEAGPYLEAVVESTGSAESRFALADFYIRVGRYDEAVALLEPMLNDPRTAMDAQLQLADLDHRAGRVAQAHGRLAGLLEGPDNHRAQLLSAELLVRERNFDEARTWAELAVEAVPTEARGHMLLARARAGEGDVDGAIGSFEEALALVPGDWVAMRELSRLYLQTGDGERALRFARDAVAAGARDVESRLVLTRALLAQDLEQTASQELDRLAASHPDVAGVRVQQGVLAARQGRRAAAVAAFEQALTIDPNNLAALEGLVSLDLASGATTAVRGRIDEWIATRSEDTASLSLAAAVYASLGDEEQAERLLRQVLNVDSSHLAAYSALGRLYARQGRLGEALAEYEALAERSRNPVSALTMAGIILQAQGQVDGARRKYERAVGLDPEAAVAANNLAWIYSETGGNLDVALGLSQRATAKLPDLPQTNDTLGWVHYKKGLASLAIPYFEKSIARDADNPVYHFHLGLAHLGADNPVKAREALERALELDVEFDGLAEAQRLLIDLGTSTGSEGE